MGGNRKHGYARGNRGGFRGSPWFCEGCQKEHPYRRERNGYNGKSWCDMTFYRDVRDPKTGALKI
jgi:hypothetical protein